jgi:hypothetical protein
MKIRVLLNGNGSDARIAHKRLRLSSLNSLHVTLTGNRNGLRHLDHHLSTHNIFIVRGSPTGHDNYKDFLDF